MRFIVYILCLSLRKAISHLHLYLFHRTVHSLIDFAWCLMFLSFGKGKFSSALYFISKIFNISKENQLDFGDLKYNTLSHFITCKKNI